MKNYYKIFHFVTLILISTVAFSFPKLSSLPGAKATIYLDFDGHIVRSSVWNGGNPIVCGAPSLSDDQISEIFFRVSEDYRPFDVNITTDSTVFLSAPLTQRIRIIITPTSSWKAGVGGIAYIGSFTWGDDTPAFVFSDRLGPNNSKYIAECCSHESGHTLGLSHQASFDNNCKLTETYNSGIGSGETSWAPIMGNSYYRNNTGWNAGPTPSGCNSIQDNLKIISTKNGFNYRIDDYVETLNEAAFSPGNTSFNVNGILSTNTDKDAFKFVFSQFSNFHFEANPFNLGASNDGANLDIKVMLYDNDQNLLKTFDPISTMSVSIDTSLKSGTYYFVITGAGSSNSSNYGSLGSYTITGFRSTLAIRNVKLNGSTEKNQHHLEWSIEADEPVQTQTLEVSDNGSSFTKLVDENKDVRKGTYQVNGYSNKYYRLKVSTVTGQTAYSNVVMLQSNDLGVKPFVLSGLTKSYVNINAQEPFKYKIFDANGRTIVAGSGNRGMNQIDMSNKSSGIYIIQLLTNNQQLQVERIFKQ
ncbi:MAG: T9SS type A sorting domain-containing protein [Ferruginibacter sp.]|nr:T9SS type A sorting domain-containing protein [Ferruginibacter sp.]